MKLRNAHLAIVELNKVVNYLLNATHPDNGGKARFFKSLGYFPETAERLVDALREVAMSGQVAGHVTSTHGSKYVVDGVLSSQTGNDARGVVRTVWIVDRGSDAPRLVTAYPGRSEPSL